MKNRDTRIICSKHSKHSITLSLYVNFVNQDNFTIRSVFLSSQKWKSNIETLET